MEDKMAAGGACLKHKMAKWRNGETAIYFSFSKGKKKVRRILYKGSKEKQGNTFYNVITKDVKMMETQYWSQHEPTRNECMGCHPLFHNQLSSFWSSHTLVTQHQQWLMLSVLLVPLPEPKRGIKEVRFSLTSVLKHLVCSHSCHLGPLLLEMDWEFVFTDHWK